MCFGIQYGQQKIPFLYKQTKKKKNIFKNRNKLRLNIFIKSRVFNRLYKAPQRKGTITRLAIMTPKKPNSAIRHVAKVAVYQTNRQAICRIPGDSRLPSSYDRVLFRGGRANDLPTVRTTLIRGVFDLSALYGKIRRRSIYGVPRPENTITHRRRRYRHLDF